MRKMVLVVACVCVISTAAWAQLTEAAVRNRIVGTWKIVSTEQVMKDGSKRPDPVLGAHGKAFLMYTADGYMCAELMNPDRPTWKNKEKPTLEDKATSFDGFFAYCGRYEIHADKNLLVHLPEVSMTQDYLGTRQIRPYRFEGNRMILGDKGKGNDPEVASWQLVWEKVKD